MLSTVEFNQKIILPRLKFRNLYDLPKTVNTFRNYLYILQKNKRKLERFVYNKHFDNIFFLFCIRTRHPVLNNDIRKIIYEDFLLNNKKNAARIILYYYRKSIILNYFSNVCTNFFKGEY